VKVNDFMQDNYKELHQAAVRISQNSELADELLHHCMEEFLVKKNVEEIVASGGGRFYLVRMMMNQWNSNTSPFFYTYRKQHDEITDDFIDIIEEEDEEFTKTADRIRAGLDGLCWYDRILFDTFVQENHTVSSLARATKIPRTSISLSINRIRRHIKTQIEPQKNQDDDKTNQMEI
jgi:DNA-directed RNA polymerase specialized sigma24 family protein